MSWQGPPDSIVPELTPISSTFLFTLPDMPPMGLTASLWENLPPLHQCGDFPDVSDVGPPDYSQSTGKPHARTPRRSLPRRWRMGRQRTPSSSCSALHIMLSCAPVCRLALTDISRRDQPGPDMARPIR